MTTNKTTARIYDARGNGGGLIAPTITGDHQNRVTDYTAIVLEEKRMEPFVIEADTTIKIGGVCFTLGGTRQVPIVLETLVFNAAQITSPQNGNNPEWGGSATRSPSETLDGRS